MNTKRVVLYPMDMEAFSTKSYSTCRKYYNKVRAHAGLARGQRITVFHLASFNKITVADVYFAIFGE